MNNVAIDGQALPESVKRIKRVNIKENLYERHHLERAGYTEANKVGNEPNVGYYTTWKHTSSRETLIFLERKDGFYTYVGIFEF